MYCRGCPPWLPLRGIQTRGGHGGPPLQYVPRSFRHVDAGVEDVGLRELLVLGHDDRESFVLAAVFALKETHGAVILRVFRVADAALLIRGPTGRFHAFF